MSEKSPRRRKFEVAPVRPGQDAIPISELSRENVVVFTGGTPTQIPTPEVETASPTTPFLPKTTNSGTSTESRPAVHRSSLANLYRDTKEKKHYTLLSNFLSGFTVPNAPTDKESTENKTQKAKLGVILGVFLPDVQNVFGILMFLRLYWLVGIAGVHEAFWLVLMCCLCTFLTAISLSAIATNGVMQSGGPYFMISRNLGPQIGAGVGLLFYMANTIATAMYVAGGIEILVKYIAPQIPAFYKDEDRIILDLENTVRVYGTGMLLLTFIIVAMGVKFVQFFAPISLFSVLISILAVFVGGFIAGQVESSVKICLVGDRLLRYQMWNNGTPQCNTNNGSLLFEHFCGSDRSGTEDCEDFLKNLRYIDGFPGFKSGIINENAKSQYSERQPKNAEFAVQDLATSFFVLLAIYFPSVTGILTGCNMSGDLKDPQKSLPIGTIVAQIFTSVVYLGLVIVFGGAIDGSLLRDKYGDGVDGGLDNQGNIRGGGMIIAKLAWPSEWIVLIGSFASTFGAGLQSLCSAPRLLQSIAKDDLVPKLKYFAPSNRFGEPFRALILTLFLSECAVLLGQVDQIAPILDYFFLMCYCFINLSCAVQTLVHAPNWRPRFRYYHWSLSLAGAVLCIFIMWATHWYYALPVWIACVIVYKIVEIYGAKKEWGSGLRGLALSAAQYSLLKYEDDAPHPKNWRPQLLLLVKPTEIDKQSGMIRPKALKMLAFARQLKSAQGLTMVTSLLQGNVRNEESRELAKTIKSRLKSEMKDLDVPGFADVILVDEGGAPMNTIMQSCGIGGLRPNTLILGWPSGWKSTLQNPGLSKNRQIYLSIFQQCVVNATSTGYCLTIVKGVENFPGISDRLTGFVDIWWIMEDGGLLLLLPFLLQKHQVWRKCRLRVFAVSGETDNSTKMQEALENWCYQLRIDAVVSIIELDEEAISPYTHERTMQMKDRARLASQLKLTKTEMSKAPQFIRDAARLPAAPKSSPKSLASTVLSTATGGPSLSGGPSQSWGPSPSRGPSPPRGRKVTSGEGPNSESQRSGKSQKSEDPEESSVADKSEMVKSMHAAIRLNRIIQNRSKPAQLVFLNLPRLSSASNTGFIRYLEYLEALTEDIDKIVLVKGSGMEVITIYT